MTANDHSPRMPRWFLILLGVVLLIALAPGSGGALLAWWNALSLMLTVLPFVGLALYLRSCRKRRVRPTFRGYWAYICVVRQLRFRAYHGAAKLLLPGDAPRVAVVVFAWLLIVLTVVIKNWQSIGSLFQP